MKLCDSNRLLSVLDLGATPPCEKLLTAEELERTFPLHLRVCEDCLLLQIPALITPEATFTEIPARPSRRGQANRRLWSTRQGQHAAQLPRYPHRPARVHRRPQSVQTHSIHARDTHPKAYPDSEVGHT